MMTGPVCTQLRKCYPKMLSCVTCSSEPALGAVSGMWNMATEILPAVQSTECQQVTPAYRVTILTPEVIPKESALILLQCV